MAKHNLFYAIVLPGLETLAAAELTQLSAHDMEIEHGGVRFSGSIQLLYRVNLRSRFITRVLMRLRKFSNITLEGLGFEVEKIAWHLFLSAQSQIKVQVSTRHSRLNHSEAIAQQVSRSIKTALPQIGTDTAANHVQTIHIHIDNNHGSISLDTSGERLDKRGYRLESAKAPMRETLAAAMIQWSGWQPEQMLLVPMCGSGTIAIEAALFAQKCAVNQHHDFACLHWHNVKHKTFEAVLEKSIAMKTTLQTNILASDIHKGGIEISQRNAQRAEVASLISFKVLDIHLLNKPSHEAGGVVLLNPPYGQRIGESASTLSLWHDLGCMLKKQFLNDPLWKVVIICPDPSLEKALHVDVTRRLKVTHGGLAVQFLELN